MEPGAELLDRICEMLEAHGVSHYIVAFRDPDSNSDRYNYHGSQFWIIGAAECLADTHRKDFHDIVLREEEE